MSLVSPSIKNAQFNATVYPTILSPLSETVPVAVPINFASVANLKVISGSYTPANDTLVIADSLSAISPNFFMLICDGQVLLKTNNGMIVGLPVNKMAMATLIPIVSGANPINQFILDGQTVSNYPMAQGVAVNYTLIIGQATIS